MLNKYRVKYRQSKYSAFEWWYVEQRKWLFWWEEVDWFKTRKEAEQLIRTLEYNERINDYVRMDRWY